MAISKSTRFKILRRDGFRCVYCGAEPTSAALHVDHVVPRAQGGRDDPANLATACDDCNLGKGAGRLPDEGRERLLYRITVLSHITHGWEATTGQEIPDELLKNVRAAILTSVSWDALTTGLHALYDHYEVQSDRDARLFWNGVRSHMDRENSRDAEALLG